jgi:hypothetical protein
MITMTIETPSIPESLKNPGEIIRQEIMRASAEATITLRNAMVESSPRDTGTLANSWDLKNPVAYGNVFEASTGSTQPQALVIEGGAKPHFPSPQIALQGWVERKITNPVLAEAQKTETTVKGKVKLYKEAKNKAERLTFLIARAISHRGLPSTQNAEHTGTFSRALARTKSTIDQIFHNATDRISARFMGGKS